MDYIAPVVPPAALTDRASLPDDATHTKGVKEIPHAASPALDPRPAYILSSRVADAVLAVAQLRLQTVAGVEEAATRAAGQQSPATLVASAVAATPAVASEATRSVGPTLRNWAEDVRLDNDLARVVGADTVIEYEVPQVFAAWNAVFPDLPTRKFRGVTFTAGAMRAAVDKTPVMGGPNPNDVDIYLLCNAQHFDIFRQDYPEIKVNWIDVDNEELMLFWPDNHDERV
jgi:hypothetical protein